ncbi:hypothetical protein IFM89_024438 [Coptis chinensis]|uniref:DYW domain-containing protein n=1 Tax=Coptis chinensis TaxID=261450 RepID=A0A835HJM9_9MAGN|nr:hypothetical protein IFM89_024438 [Coptis chinensis]
MPYEPTAAILGSLLGACAAHKNVFVGEFVARRLFEIEPENAGNYIILSNLYASNGRWEDVRNVRELMKGKDVAKEPGRSWVKLDQTVHTFHVGDWSHPQKDEVLTKVKELLVKIKEAGYVCDLSCVLHDVDDEQKERMLLSHSEKLAIALRLIGTCSGVPIKVTYLERLQYVPPINSSFDNVPLDSVLNFVPTKERGRALGQRKRSTKQIKLIKFTEGNDEATQAVRGNETNQVNESVEGVVAMRGRGRGKGTRGRGRGRVIGQVIESNKSNEGDVPVRGRGRGSRGGRGRGRGRANVENQTEASYGDGQTQPPTQSQTTTVTAPMPPPKRRRKEASLNNISSQASCTGGVS